MITLKVTAERAVSYDVIHVSRHVFDICELSLAELCTGRQTLIAVDEKVFSIYGAAIRNFANAHLNCSSIVLVDGSEKNKSWDQVARICKEALNCGLRRDGVIVAVGGGVTLDVVGVAATLYRRGLRFVRIPTTLVGLVDVCVGIKHGINFGLKKNALGSFYPPFGCINDLSFLRTLPRRELACGIAEIVKIAIMCDELLFELIERNEKSLIDGKFQTPQHEAETIAVRAERAMINELQPNLYEHDLLRMVDFGHTFSPLLEERTNYALGHGEAVAIDMLLSTAIAEQRGICDESVLNRLTRVCAQADLPLCHNVVSPQLLSEALDRARAQRGGNLNFAVPTRIGAGSFIQDLDGVEVEKALRYLAGREVTPDDDLASAGSRG